ncbi:MAG: FCSD flavin-binding domain-containing protein [Hyphomicrobium sp.]
MTEMTRRGFGAGLAGLTLGLAAERLSLPAVALGEAKVLIVGGGAGGASVAVTVKRAAPQLDVTLIEAKSEYTTCFFSNHYIAGLRSLASITHGYEGLRALGIRVIHDTATAIDTSRKSVKVKRGKELTYDRLVVAPGIDLKFDGIEGYSEAAAEIMPHAWKGGAQTKLLKRRLDALDDGDTVVLTAPRAPYRCPPGPYERACVIAHHLKTKLPKSKLVILDPKLAFSKQAVFEEAFRTIYKDIVELDLSNDIDSFAVTRVDTRTGEVLTKAGKTVKGALVNLIPDQKAGAIAHLSGLTVGDWCPVHFENFTSTKAEHVYVIGDAAIADGMPKSAFSAHSQATAVAGHMLADLAGKERPDAKYRNTCWSWLAPNDSVKIGADYAPGEVGGKAALAPSGSFVSKTGESTDIRKSNYDDSLAWYDTLVGSIYPSRSGAPKTGSSKSRSPG